MVVAFFIIPLNCKPLIFPISVVSSAIVAEKFGFTCSSFICLVDMSEAMIKLNFFLSKA